MFQLSFISFIHPFLLSKISPICRTPGSLDSQESSDSFQNDSFTRDPSLTKTCHIFALKGPPNQPNQPRLQPTRPCGYSCGSLLWQEERPSHWTLPFHVACVVPDPSNQPLQRSEAGWSGNKQNDILHYQSETLRAKQYIVLRNGFKFMKFMNLASLCMLFLLQISLTGSAEHRHLRHPGRLRQGRSGSARWRSPEASDPRFPHVTVTGAQQANHGEKIV